MPAVAQEEVEAVRRVEGPEDRRVAHHLRDAERRDGREPEEHHGPEEAADSGRAAALDEKQSDDDDDRRGDDVGGEERRRHVEALDGAEHRDGRRDDAVAVEQRRPEDADHDQPRALAFAHDLDGRRQRRQREDAALAAVVGAQDEDAILDRDDEDQRPEDERHHAEDVLRRRGDGVRPVEALAQRVERTRPDVAVDDAEGGERKQGEVAPPRRGRVRVPLRVRECGVDIRRRCSCHVHPWRKIRSHRDATARRRRKYFRTTPVAATTESGRWIVDSGKHGGRRMA